MARKPSPPLTIIGQCKISLDGQMVSYILKHSSRARCARLEIGRIDGLVIVVPRYFDAAQISWLLQKKKRWILSNLAQRHQKSPPQMKGLRDGDSIPYLGRELKLVIRRNAGQENSVLLERSRLIISLVDVNSRIEPMLEKWYRAQAEQFLMEKVKKLSAEMSLSYNRLTVRGQRSRWASCSYQRNLSFNWKLMMIPEPVIDYVVIHELLHLREMSHAKRFWKLVAEHCPDWMERRQWLNEHEAELKTRFSY